MAKGGVKGPPDGGGGDDGGGGNDGQISFNGKRKDDLLIGNELPNDMWGRDGNDILYGMGGNDLLVGGDGDDILYGDFGMLEPTSDTDVAGDDRLFGGDGNDQLYGGAGNDELQGGDGLDILDGGDGYDIALYSADDYSITVTPDGSGTGFDIVFHTVVLGSGDPGPTDLNGKQEYAENIEGIVGTYYDDVMIGANTSAFTLDGYMNVFDGYYGDDIIYGGIEADWLAGGGDDDDIYGLGGNDMLLGGSGTDTIDGGAGNDTIYGGSNAWWEAPDTDVIDGGTGDDTISGGGGADTLTGGLGADTFLYYSASEGGDSIIDFDGDLGEGDLIDLTALGLDGGSNDITSAMVGGFIFVVGDDLFVDLDGGGTGDGTGDDVLIATITDDGAGFTLASDVLI